MKTESSSLPRRVKQRINWKNKEMTMQDKAIFTHANNLLKLLKSKKTLINIPFQQSLENISLVYYAFEKEVYNKWYSLFLSHYLSSLRPLMNILPQNNSKETLMLLSQKLIFEKHQMNQLLFRFGDLADKFYIILKGSVSVIIYKEIEIKMKFEEYLIHLKRLKELKEYVLMNKIITINSHIIKESKVNSILFLLSNETEEERNVAIQNSLNVNHHFNSYHSYNTYSSNNNNSDNINEIISAADYIQRSLPQTVNKDNITNNNKNTYNFTLWVYFNLCTLDIGKTFGDIALSNDNCVRTGSIICNEDCYLGSLTKADYDYLVKDSQEKLKKVKITTILSSPIFIGVRVDTFIKKYFNCFKELELEQGMTLFSQGDEREEIFLIKEGEIEITTRLSFNELTTIIIDKGGVIDNSNEKMLFYDLFIHDIPMKYRTKRLYKLSVLKDGEVCGLNDCLFHNKYFCTAVCSSFKSTIYSIQHSMFQKLVEDEECIKNNFPGFVEVKTEVLRNRLVVFRNNEISNRCKSMPLLSEKDRIRPLFQNNTTTTVSNTNNSILLNSTVHLDGMARMKSKGCFTSRNKSETDNKNLEVKYKLQNMPHAIIDNTNKRRVYLNKEDKSERMVHYSSTIKFQFDRLLAKSSSDKKSKANLDNVNQTDRYLKKISNEPNTTPSQSPSQLELNIKTNNISNKTTSPQKKMKKKILALSSSCYSLDDNNKKIKNTILQQMLNITARNSFRSKGLSTNTRYGTYKIKRKTVLNINAYKEKQIKCTTNKYNPSVIDFLAMDKVYENAETKKNKKSKPKKTLIPLNFLLLKKYKIPSSCSNRSLNVN